MKGVKTDNNLLTIQMMSDKTGLSKKIFYSVIKKLEIPVKRITGINGYIFTNEQFKMICADDFIFEKMYNYNLRDYNKPPVIITYHVYESKMNYMDI
jgi:hypothetical protein